MGAGAGDGAEGLTVCDARVGGDPLQGWGWGRGRGFALQMGCWDEGKNKSANGMVGWGWGLLLMGLRGCHWGGRRGGTLLIDQAFAHGINTAYIVLANGLHRALAASCQTDVKPAEMQLKDVPARDVTFVSNSRPGIVL